MDEKLIWKGNPSQWINLGTYILCVLFCWLIIPIFIAIWRFLAVRAWTMEITDQRLIDERGVFSKTTDEIELFRVKDIRLEQPFLLRLVGLSNIILMTSDKTHPVFRIPAIRDGKNIKEKLRVAVDIRRDLKGVKETDFE
jgi:uncharacterized membrane protein YdbT with pleckstrin-like domain